MRGLFVGLVALAACSPHAQAFTQPVERVTEDGGAEPLLLAYPADGGVVEWDGWAGEFVTDYCVSCHSPTAPCFGSGCHYAGDPRTPNFEEKSAVVADAPTIQCGIAVSQAPSWNCGATAPESFPVSNGDNPIPTDEQRDLMVGWVEAGCP
ncbi:MAG: hypothetical protein ACLQVI_14520 [Polyangiaceae bacterium]